MLSETLSFPEDLFAVYVPGWNLGDVIFTAGVQNLIERTEEDEFPVEQLLAAHFGGSYGFIGNNASEMVRAQNARIQGQPFTGVWSNGNVVIKIVTNPMLRRTTVLLACED